MKNLIFISFILIILFKTGNVLSDNNIFNVNNIEISQETSKNKEKLVNTAFQKAFNELNLGDICLLGRLRRDEGLRYMGIVKTKKIIEEKTDDWPFKTPSGTYWKYAFTLSSVYEINISNIKYASFLFFTKNKNLLNKNINEIKAFMNSINIPIFIDIAPGYLHTTGELHKNKSDAIHFLVHEEFSEKIN